MQKLHDNLRFPGDLIEHARAFVRLAAEAEALGQAPYERAARALAVDTSVLRRRISTLTEFVGTPLLAGRGARLRLSAAGTTVRSRCDALLACAREIADAPPLLTIACTGTIVSEVLPGVLIALERTAPGMRVRVKRAGSAACLDLVTRGEVDIGVVRAVKKPAGVVAERLCDDRLWLAVPSGHALARGRVDLQALAHEPLVLFGEASQTRGRVLSILEPLGAQVRVEVDGRSSALEYVARKLGISFVSLVPGHDASRRGVVLRDVTASFPKTSFWIVRASKSMAIPARDALVAQVGLANASKA